VEQQPQSYSSAEGALSLPLGAGTSTTKANGLGIEEMQF